MKNPRGNSPDIARLQPLFTRKIDNARSAMIRIELTGNLTAARGLIDLTLAHFLFF